MIEGKGDPTSWAFGTWALAVVMALAGGAVNWWARVRQGHIKLFSVFELLGEMFTSGFVGLGVFMVALAYSIPDGVAAAAAGVSGHMAARLLFIVERAIEAKLIKAAGLDRTDIT